MPASSCSQASLAEVAREFVPAASQTKASSSRKRQPMKSAGETSPSRQQRSGIPKKDLRHLDSRKGVKAALKAEKGDTRWDSSPRFVTPPSNCYAQRAKRGDESDRVLDNIIRNRPITEVERRRIKENRLALRQHVGLRDGHQLFVPSFQQERAQDEHGVNIRVATRYLMSSGRDTTERPKSSAKIGSPEHNQRNGRVSAREANGVGNPNASVGTATPQQALAAAIAEADDATSRSRQQPRQATPQRGSGSGSMRGKPESPTVPYVSSKCNPGDFRNGMMAWRATGRPPPSCSSSKLSESNLKEHERKQGDLQTPRSGRRRSSRRSGSMASSCSSRSGKQDGRVDLRSSSYGESDYGADSAMSEPLRQVDWDQLVAKAERQGAAFRRSQSAEVLNPSQSSGSSPLSPRRRLRGPGAQPNDTMQELIISRTFGSEEPYKRWRGVKGGAPPPQKIQGVFDRDIELSKSSQIPYRRLRGARNGTPPPDTLHTLGRAHPGSDPMFPTPVATHHRNKELLSASQMPYRTYRRVRSSRSITPPPDKLSGSLGMQPGGYDPIYPTPLQVSA